VSSSAAPTDPGPALREALGRILGTDPELRARTGLPVGSAWWGEVPPGWHATPARCVLWHFLYPPHGAWREGGWHVTLLLTACWAGVPDADGEALLFRAVALLSERTFREAGLEVRLGPFERATLTTGPVFEAGDLRRADLIAKIEVRARAA
jgi:hypothetical protein